jgi:N-acetylglucosamine kinase-like BadF-type ATPase
MSALTPVVVTAAEAGDATAAEVLEQAGRELARQVAIVWEKMRGHGETTGKVAYTGSVVEKIAWVRRSMRKQLAESCPGLTLADGGVHSTEGAMWRARRGTAQHAGKVAAP